jgi:hypothetical protein
VYAGAAREAVFSAPAVIRRINADFIPLALRAPLVNNVEMVRDQDEKWLYQRLSRAKLAPQGIGVLNSAGQVLAWVQMFDDDQSVLDFLDHNVKRVQQKDGAAQPALTERYMRFPSERAEDSQDEAKLPAVVAEKHPPGKSCPASAGKGKAPPGTIVARLVGRALDDQGKPLADIIKQEHYVEDQFGISPSSQKELAQVLAHAGSERVRLPDELSKLFATHAHLGHIDVQPCLCMIKGTAENKGEWKQYEFWARKMETGKDIQRWQVEGQSEVVSALSINGNGVHNVKLSWEGFLELKEQRLTRLLLSGRGKEVLEFAKDHHPLKQSKRDEVAFLPGGRPIDLACSVRYGIRSEAASADGEPGEKRAQDPAEQIPDQVRKDLANNLGGSFVIFRHEVQEELKLSEEQKQKLEQQLHERVQDAMQFFQKLEGAKPEERPRELEAYRQKAREQVMAFAKEILNQDQQKRVRQLLFQQEGPFALGGEIGKELKITDEQRKQFMAVAQELQRKVEPLVQEAQSGGSPEEIRPKLMKLRKEQEAKIVALLTVAQKKQWQEMLGKPLELQE